MVDGQGRLIHRGQWVSLSPIHERMVGLLAEHFGDVVSNDELMRTAWPGDPPTLNAVRVHLNRIRHRIAPLGLEIRGVRLHGQIMEEKSALA